MAMMDVLLYQHPGPLPLKGSFQCKANQPLDVFVQGTSVRNTKPGAAGCEIYIRDSSGKDVVGGVRHSGRDVPVALGIYHGSERPVRGGALY
jgi:hypothetical protein